MAEVLLLENPMKKFLIFTLLSLATVFAGEGTPVYNSFSSFGLEGAFFRPVSKSWSDERSAFGETNFIANLQILPYTSVTGDIGYSFPGNGFNVKIGLQQQLLPTDIAPFIGGMAGLNTIPEDDFANDFGDRIGPSVEANAGLYFFRESFFSLRIKGAYQWTFAKDVDHGFGVSIGILFANSRPGLKAIDVSR